MNENINEQCHGKKQYADKNTALMVTHKMNRTNIKRTVYKCPSCGLWHIGSGLRNTDVLHKRKKMYDDDQAKFWRMDVKTQQWLDTE